MIAHNSGRPKNTKVFCCTFSLTKLPTDMFGESEKAKCFFSPTICKQVYIHKSKLELCAFQQNISVFIFKEKLETFLIMRSPSY